MRKIVVEYNHRYRKDCDVAELEKVNVFVTPPLGGDEDWLFRTWVSKDQAIVAFPKFGTIGIGFMREEDWNTNLPYTSDAVKIYEHIRHNKDCSASRPRCIAAIEALQESIKQTRVSFLVGGGDELNTH